MSKKVIHVNRHFIAFNAKNNANLPVYTTKMKGKTIYSHGVKILGPSTLVDPRVNGQLSCGARAWIETESEIEFIDPCTFAEVKKLQKELVNG